MRTGKEEFQCTCEPKQVGQEGLGNFAIGGDDYVTGLLVRNAQRYFLSQQNIGQRFSQLSCNSSV